MLRLFDKCFQGLQPGILTACIQQKGQLTWWHNPYQSRHHGLADLTPVPHAGTDKITLAMTQ